jgi:ubiquinone/menaquinone biosynthesis C-methylase UbiE
MKRMESEELLDSAEIPRDEMEPSLRDLRFINKFGGGVSIYRKMVGRFQPGSILDLGAGTTDLLDSLKHVRLRIGLDFRIEHLAYLREGSSSLRVVGDAHHLPFRDHAVDLVTSSHFFHHFSPGENDAILRESLRVARRGVAVSDTRRSVIPFLFVKLIGALRLISRITRFDAPASVRQAYTPDEVEQIARKLQKRHEVQRAWPFRWIMLLWK